MFRIQNLPLIPQTYERGCWFAAAQMIVEWKRRATGSCTKYGDLGRFPEGDSLIKFGRGLSPSHVVPFAKSLGFRAVSPMSVSLETIETWLRAHGPLWVHGIRHIVVIAGVDQAKDTVFVYDPYPVNIGSKGWRPYSSWFANGTDDDSQRTDSKVQASFLYFP